MTQHSMPIVGEKAPTFSGPIQDGSTISLSDYVGQKLAIYFYPRDNTPGCTKQACNLRDNFDALAAKGIAIIGVSDDSVEAHVKFTDGHNLTFPLIADTDRTMLNSYGVYGEKSMYGRKYMGTKRVTFLIDEDQNIKHVFLKPKVGRHAEEIIEAFGT